MLGTRGMYTKLRVEYTELEVSPGIPETEEVTPIVLTDHQTVVVRVRPLPPASTRTDWALNDMVRAPPGLHAWLRLGASSAFGRGAVGFRVGDQSSRGRFATPAQSLQQDCGPYRGLHARRERVGVVHRGSFSVAPVPPSSSDSLQMTHCSSTEALAFCRMRQ
jgi:hypothetical protein